MPKHSPPATIRDEDTELIQAINDGRGERFHDLVGRYQRTLYNFGVRMCGDRRDAEDLVQETFLNVFRYLKGFRFETRFKNWLFRVAASVCTKSRRRSRHAKERELSLEEFLPGDESEFDAPAPRWASKPLEHLLDRELAEHLRKAIHALPKKYRLVTVLRDVEGFSTAETAQILDISTSNVKVRLHRARLYLRQQLKDYYRDDPSPP